MKHLNYFNNFTMPLDGDISESDTSATGGISSGGMGAIVSAQPSSLPGSTMSPDATCGSGDIGVPYNPGTGAKLMQKIPAMGYNHGSRTGKKSRTKKLDLKQLKANFKAKKDTTTRTGEKRVMSFDDFQKADINKVTKVSDIK